MDNVKILVLGATGAMAVYLIPELLNKGYAVTGVSLDDAVSNDENLTYIKADATDLEFLKQQLSLGYDAVVDFMVYNSVELFKKYYRLFLENTRHYLFFSTPYYFTIKFSQYQSNIEKKYCFLFEYMVS